MSEKLICSNPKAFHDYFIEEKIEAGVILSGAEVKSLRQGKATIKESHVLIKNGEAFIMSLHISPYQSLDRFSPEPDRTRKLLLHRKEIDKLMGRMKEKGYSLVPTKLYFKGARVKVEIGLAKGKKQFDKRETIKKKEVGRELDRVMKERGR